MERIALFLKIFIFALFISIAVRYIAVQPFVVADNAMMPEFQMGDIVLVNRFAHLDRGSLVVVRDEEVGQRSLGRIVALPGERISVTDGIISIVDSDGERRVNELPLFGTVALTLPGVGQIDAHEFFVMPNHLTLAFSGLVDRRHIIGSPIVRIYPFSRVKIFNK